MGMDINVLIRTSNRPKYFAECFKSVIDQTYIKNTKIIVSVDNSSTLNYVVRYPVDKIVDIRGYEIPKPNRSKEIIVGRYRRKYSPAHWNWYFNLMMNECYDGLIVYLDDDDKFTVPYALQMINDFIKTEDDLLFWRVQFPGQLVPNDKAFGKEPIPANISTIGFSFHTKYIEQAQWQPYSYGDFRVAHKLYNTIPNKIFIRQILTKVNRKKAGGHGKRDDL